MTTEIPSRSMHINDKSLIKALYECVHKLQAENAALFQLIEEIEDNYSLENGLPKVIRNKIDALLANKPKDEG